MNQCASKPPIPFGLKVRKMWDGKFYLSPADRDRMAELIEGGVLVHDRDGVAFIDEHGEWLP